jgi:hypothetical protein
LPITETGGPLKSPQLPVNGPLFWIRLLQFTTLHSVHLRHCQAIGCDCRRVFVWWPDFLDPLKHNAWLHFTVYCYTHECPQLRPCCRCLIEASNGGCSPSSGFSKSPRPQLQTSNNSLQWLKCSNSLTATSQSQSQSQSQKVKVMLRPTVFWSVCLVLKHPSGAQDQVLITVRQLRVCWCGAPSLTWGRICPLQMLLGLASAVILEYDSCATHDHILLSSMCVWTIFSTTFSNSLPVVDKRIIGHRFWGNIESLPGFGEVITFASFQDFGKCERRMQWLIKYIKCTNGLLGRCLRHSFEMTSIPQAFLNFKEFINLCT